MSSEDVSLQLTQEQRLQQRLSPQQVMFGRVLEMSSPEIEDEVRRELDDNPALEIASSDHEIPEENSFEETSDELMRADYADTDDIPFYDEFHARSKKNSQTDFDLLSLAEADNDDEGSIHSVLESRLSDLNLTPQEHHLAEYIIGNLDSNGYLHRTLSSIASDIAAAEGVEPDIQSLRKVFAKIRTLEPAGIGAVDLRDCLLLQLDRMPSSLPQRVAREIIADNFDIFSKKHFERLQNHLGVDEEILQDALRLIRTLNPKPGALLGGSASSDRANHIIPDFAVEPEEGTGIFNVTLINRTPELTIDESFSLDQYSAQPNATRQQREAYAFIKRKHDDARQFIRMLQERSRTLLTVMEAIVARQAAFFISGNTSDLAPMILKDISGDTGFDISTVSRAASGKYVLTPHGTYPLKLFFNERPKAQPDSTSHKLVEAMREIIDKEDKRHPYSDEALKEILIGKGFDIARRTVAKYREKLGYPVGRLRKSFNKTDSSK